MTLTELAIELRKIFKFKYLILDDSTIELCNEAPYYGSVGWHTEGVDVVACFWDYSVIGLDLSEYRPYLKTCDYSKCIVEVE